MLFDVKHFIRDGLCMEWVADAYAVWLHRKGLALWWLQRVCCLMLNISSVMGFTWNGWQMQMLCGG
jgi:hypothetical protein